MKRGLAIVNLLLLALFGMAFIGVARESKDFATSLGAGIWLVVPILCFAASRADSSRGLMKAAFWANVIGIVIAVIVSSVMARQSLGTAIGILIIVVALAWNAYALKRLREAREIELVADDEPTAWRAASPDIAAPAPENANYIVRHWRGELSLPVSYWINGSLIGLGMLIVFGLIGTVTADWELRPSAFLALAMLSTVIVVTLWSVVGTWRSASQHVSRGGSSGWAVTAQVMTVIGILSFIGRIATQIGPQMQEYASIALDQDSLGKIDATLATDGQALVLRGAFGTGSAGEVTRILTAAPGVRSVVLDSHGGRLREAEQVADLVRKRKLNTYVEGQCLSACTYIFLAGADRAATPNARIGFHRPSFSGATGEEAGLGSMLAVYRAAGITEVFLERVKATASDSMWYPTRDELIDNGVINRISLGGESAAMSSTLFRSKAELALAYAAIPMIAAIDRRFPGTLGQAVDAAWSQHEKGAIDADINSAARRIFADAYPRLLAAADDESLDEFLDLLVNQLSAAKAVSFEACSMLLDSRLDVSKTLPKEVVEQEMRWAIQALNKPVAPAREPLGQAAFDQALAPVLEVLDEGILQVVGDQEAYADQPEARCNSLLAFYEGVQAQPTETRSVLMRGMFQSEDSN